ncbi:hypothetical protein GOP47_0010548 [Adiantum capillus-veneris]|uniref:PIH1D1/2/3 CS-like domain-containing protein n=1 Tax=Adiantum capillus-veneris TaxID=13818 RepID=A0A9D4ZHW1_ADICA|nr:hypothetical protein GOP47_0010548 [Adiantum capillus-veneris]
MASRIILLVKKVEVGGQDTGCNGRAAICSCTREVVALNGLCLFGYLFLTTIMGACHVIEEDNSLRPKKKGSVTPATIGSSTYNKKKESTELEKLDPDFEFGDKYGRIQPEYDIIYKQDVSPNDVYLQMSDKDPSSLSCDIMILRVKLPQTECASEIQLDVKAKYVKLTTNLYFLALYLPQQIKHESSRAKWEIDRETLVITMPIDREPFL